MKINGGALEFFYSLPDELLIQIAENDWESLESLCMALTLDVELLNQESKKFQKTSKKNLDS